MPLDVRRLIPALATFVLCLAAPAVAGGPQHLVDASPTVDGTAIHRADIQVVRVGGDTIDAANVAQANPHDCTGCEGVAVAFQAVIYKGSPSTIAPQNLAAAVNSNCTGCGAFAYAYQYAVNSDGKLSRGARAEIRAMEDEAQQDVDAGLPYPELDAKLHDLADRFRAAVDAGLTGERHGHEAERKDEQPAPAGE
jgi:putative peptide zinc metalloprotease protein